MDDDMMVNHEVATDCAEFDKEERRGEEKWRRQSALL